VHEPLTAQERRLGERLATHLDVLPLDQSRTVVQAAIAVASSPVRAAPRHGVRVLLAAAALALVGIGAVASGAFHLDVVFDTLLLPSGPSLPAPPPLPTLASKSSPSPDASPTVPSPVPLEVVNGDVLIGYGGRIFLTDPTGEREAFELAGPDGPDWGPQWSPDGRRILVYNGSVDGEPDLSVWVMRPDGRGAQRLTGTPEVPIRRAQDAVWSPDGSRIAMRGEIDGRVGLYVVDRNARSIVASTTDAGMALEPAWSPDGTQIAIHVAEGRIAVWTMGEGAPKVVVDRGTVSGPTWGRNGTLVFWEYVTTSGNEFYWAIFDVRPDGSGARQLTDPGNGREDAQPKVSPDGRSLAFLRADRTGGGSPGVCCGIILRSFETGEERLVGDYSGAIWSPDGRWIAVQADNPAVAPPDPTSTKTEWIAIRIADGEQRFLLSRNAFGGPIIGGQEISWGPLPPA
jgi:dipeptidyl aminopeptidase/acylaminoacyl peptidase